MLTGGNERRERLRVPIEVPRNWMQFADGDVALLTQRARSSAGNLGSKSAVEHLGERAAACCSAPKR